MGEKSVIKESSKDRKSQKRRSEEKHYCDEKPPKRQVLFTIFPKNLQMDIFLNLALGCSKSSKKDADLSTKKLSRKYPVGSGLDHFKFNQTLETKRKDSYPSYRRFMDSKPSVFGDKSRAKDQSKESGKKSDYEYPGLFKGGTDVNLLNPKYFSPHDYEVEKLLSPTDDMFIYSSKFVHDYTQLGFKVMIKSGWVPDETLGLKSCEQSVLCSDQCHSCKLHVKPVDVSFSIGRAGLGSKSEKKPKSGNSDSADESCNGIDSEKAANVNRLQNADYSATSVLTLLEHSRKKMWGNPIYIEMNEKGPLHRRLFHYKVRVNNVDYVPHTGSSSKKQAKADAATGALYALGLLKHPCIMTTPAS